MTTGVLYAPEVETDYARESVYPVTRYEPEFTYHAESVDGGHDSADQRTRRAVEFADRRLETEEMSAVK